MPDRQAGARVLEHREERLAPRHAPLDVRRADAAARLEQDLPVDRAVADRRQVDRDRGRRAGAPARVHPEMRRQERVAERAWLEREARAAADHGLPALGLVRPQEDPGAIERGERALEAVRAGPAARDRPTRSRRAGAAGRTGSGARRRSCAGRDRGRPVALAEPPADHGVRRVGRRGPPKEARQAEQQTGAAAEVPGAGAPGAAGGGAAGAGPLGPGLGIAGGGIGGGSASQSGRMWRMRRILLPPVRDGQASGVPDRRPEGDTGSEQ